MNLLNRLKLPAIVGMLLTVVGFVSSCEQELTTIGEGVIGGEPFTTNKLNYEVFAFNKKIEAVQTNQLPIYQLGVFNDPVYGKTEASITSQLQLVSYNPSFGDVSATQEIEEAFDESERIDSVLIYIPYLTNQTDTDNDGVVDALDAEPNDVSNDSDNDGLTNREEADRNTDPLNPDTDGDGTNDRDDESTLGERFAKRFEIDSIYGDRTVPFNLKIEESTFFLRDLDPSSNFQEAQEYFSTQQFSPTFTDKTFFDGQVSINDEEILFVVLEDDPETDVDETGTISSRLAPGIQVRLNSDAEAFFQANLLDKEGSSELLSAANFKEFIRGIHISVTPTSEELLMLLNLTGAKLDIYYSYDKENEDATIEKLEKTTEIRLAIQVPNSPVISGNAVNTLINEDYPADITNALDTGENASRIYLKGGSGAYAEIKLFDENEESTEAIINQIKANNWIINEANLVFTIDREAIPENAIDPPRLYLYDLDTNAPLYNISTENNLTDTPLGLYLNYDGILEKSSDGKGVKYTVKITEYINNIIVRDSTNGTLGLTFTPDIRILGSNDVMLPGGIEENLPAASILSPLGTVLFGSNLPENDDKRLTLEIFYTETN